MKLISNVLIKVVRGGYVDRVMFVDNLPEELLYEMRHPRHCVGEGFKQHYEPDLSKPKVPTLYEELTLSQTGDNGILFDMDNEQAKTRYLALVRYIKNVFPAGKVLPEPIPNSENPAETSAGPLPLSKIPRVALPALSPAEAPSSVAGDATASASSAGIDVEALKKEAVEAYKQEQKAKMVKARAARQAPVKPA